ncbi:hypothetical protein C0991_000274 [Blastosporella zonata]|nr:hypothetical protein C0991_000274 [Blastosporella zonata]
MDLFTPDKDKEVKEQTGGGYHLRPSIKTTPRAKHSEDTDLHKIAQGRLDNPEYTANPIPPLKFVDGGTFLGGPSGHGWEDIAEETGRPVSTLHAEFHDLHSTAGVTQSDWRLYETYYKYNQKKEQEQHRDEDGNVVPDASASECWASFKKDPDYRKRLALHRTLRLTTSQQTVQQRRKLFNNTFDNICRAINLAHKNNFEAAIFFVGNCVNEDSSLAASHATPGLVELPERLNLTTEEILSFCKTESYHVVAKSVTKELAESRRAVSETLSDNSDVKVVDLPNPGPSKHLNVDAERNICKGLLFAMFSDFGHPIHTKTIKGKGEGTPEVLTGPLPWSNLGSILAEEGLQLVGWPWGVELPTSGSKNGIKILATVPTHIFLSALRGESQVKPTLQCANDVEGVRNCKIPVIFSVAPPPDAPETHGHVVFGDG